MKVFRSINQILLCMMDSGGLLRLTTSILFPLQILILISLSLVLAGCFGSTSGSTTKQVQVAETDDSGGPDNSGDSENSEDSEDEPEEPPESCSNVIKETLVNIGEIDIKNVQFDPGVFYVDENNQMQLACAYSNQEWIWPDTLAPCQPEDKKWVVRSAKEDTDYVIVRHLGVSAEDVLYSCSYKNGFMQHTFSLPELSNFEKFTRSFGMTLNGNDRAWFFNSNGFPEILKTRIPGSEIHAHLGHLFSKENAPILLKNKTDRVKFEVDAIVKNFDIDPGTAATLTAGIGLLHRVTGQDDQFIYLGVNLFLPDPFRLVEVIRSDTRSIYAMSFLGKDTFYVQNHGAETTKVQSGDRLDLKFSFEINYTTLNHVLKDYTEKTLDRSPASPELNPMNIHLRSFSVRNGYKFLDLGKGAMGVNLSKVTTSRLSSRDCDVSF